jgi:hypothetical protein
LKKRSKKLLVLRVVARAVQKPPTSRSFLVLFFKKELLSWLLSRLAFGARSWIASLRSQ